MVQGARLEGLCKGVLREPCGLFPNEEGTRIDPTIGHDARLTTLQGIIVKPF
jgi:hypothetical protein